MLVMIVGKMCVVTNKMKVMTSPHIAYYFKSKYCEDLDQTNQRIINKMHCHFFLIIGVHLK